ncbi:hypothetical protein [Methylocystis iwaonis]|uniref:hypothetical protein n=1 Tax=Methylocystis iwaonis TaxID=2885079 RepID=UPI002E7AE1EE|nr:hypothetical protein [Methylocystis iwaonis]
MSPGSVFFDEEFAFHDGETGEKLFVVLGTIEKVSIVAKTTSQQHGRGTVFGCQPTDRFHNFFIPPKATYFRKCTWVCLDEFYELNPAQMLKKRFDGKIKPACTLENDILRLIQECALISLDISKKQAEIIRSCIN